MDTIRKLEKYENSDILMGKDHDLYIYNKDTSFDEVLKNAIEHRCPVIIKVSSGKWILKGEDKTYKWCKKQAKKNTTMVGDGRKMKVQTLWLIKF